MQLFESGWRTFSRVAFHEILGNPTRTSRALYVRYNNNNNYLISSYVTRQPTTICEGLAK